MEKVNRNVILSLSTYPPRACGIATYTQDLTQALTRRFGASFTMRICAIEEGAIERNYPDEVYRTLDATDWREYVRLASDIDEDDTIKAVHVQHEFGLFSGPYGEDLLFLLLALRKPVIVTFHTVLKNPESNRREIVRAIAKTVEQVTVMTEHSKQVLITDYCIEPKKVAVIPHGTHTVLWKDKDQMKSRMGLHGKLVMSTFGLLSPNKGIETALQALPSIKKEFPNVLYLILGRTHPGVIATEGEAYRKYLQGMVKDFGLEHNVKFVNKYLHLDELMDYLRATDVYLFTSKDPNQAVSGTFSYAMGCGCAVVSTRIPHAVEVLHDDTGMLVDFNAPDQMAQAAIRLLADKQLREQMGLRAFERTRATAWDNVALDHARLFAKVTGTSRIRYNWPEIKLDQLRRLTDATGIIQFAQVCEADKLSGYTLDDNARALIAVSRYYVTTRDQQALELMGIYLNFIRFCQIDDGSFLNYVDHHGKHSELNHHVNLQDSNGRAVWALGYVASLRGNIPMAFVKPAEMTLQKALTVIAKLTSPRAISFAIKGLYAFNHRAKRRDISKTVSGLADQLVAYYHNCRAENWKWFEPYLTYANAIIPEALLHAYVLTGKAAYAKVARSSFEFLLSRTFRDDMIRVISNRGWLNYGSTASEFGEQPIDVTDTIIALWSFWRAYRSPQYRRQMHVAFEWFLGRNHLGQMVCNPVSGGCHDGLEETNVNLNQGAESTACYLMARLVMERLHGHAKRAVAPQMRTAIRKVIESAGDGVVAAKAQRRSATKRKRPEHQIPRKHGSTHSIRTDFTERQA